MSQTIYKIVDGTTVLYVGRTNDFKRRITQHKYNITKGSNSGTQVNLYEMLAQHNSIKFEIIVSNKYVCSTTEQHYIDTLRPLYNENNPVTKYNKEKIWVSQKTKDKIFEEQMLEDERWAEYNLGPDNQNSIDYAENCGDWAPRSKEHEKRLYEA